MNAETKQFTSDYLPLQPAMQRMAEKLLGNEQDAADVVQDCFVTLWNDRRQLRRVVNREAWCVTLSIDEQMVLAEEAPRDDERLQLALRFIDRLPERQAQVVRLRHFDDADTPTIAQRMNISEGNVYTLLSRAYNTLKQMILDHENK